MADISIIVPVYNVENYLKKCVDSILSQTYRDIEVILVDDGSTDKSGEICDKYAEGDIRVKVIHQNHKGVSYARNSGLEAAQGSYLGFVDSDDYIEKDMYETLYSCIREYDADVSICGLCDLYNGVKVWNENFLERCVLDNVTAFRLVLESKILVVSPVNKLYKKEMFASIRYPEGKTYEDAFVTPEVLYNAKKVAYAPEIKYYYVHRENSITTSKFKPSDICLIEAYDKHLKFAQKNLPKLIPQAEFRYWWANMVVIDKLIRAGKPNKNLYEEILRKIRKNIFGILKNPFFSYRRKLGSIILAISPSVYKMILSKRDKTSTVSRGEI